MREPSGEAAALQTLSASLRTVPVRVEITHRPHSSFGPAGPLASNLVPSRNQERSAQRKHIPAGTGRERVSPVSIRRRCAPLRSV